jgi:hypothetical protein
MLEERLGDEKLDTTVILTSCNRHDLLDRTLRSFREFNTYDGIAKILVVEDGDACPREICERHGAELLRIGRRIGQTRAIDLAYQTVTTPYIFHLEDDWEFYRPGFMEKSKAVLEHDPSTLLVWLRAWNDTNNHPLSFRAADQSFGVLAFGYEGIWHGFTLNPGLRRLCDYQLLGSFASRKLETYVGVEGAAAEAGASVFYHGLGYRAVILDTDGYVRHIGWDRHVQWPSAEGT